MKLYYSKGACSLAIRITLNEIGAKFESEKVNLKTKETQTGQSYLEINPKGAVPALRLDNQEILTENSMLHQYLADTFKATQLLPAVGDLNRYRVIEWLNFINTDLHKSCSPLFHAGLSKEDHEYFKNILINKLKFTDKNLKNKNFLMGNQFTVADSYLFVILTWLPALEIDISQFPELSRYFKDLKQRPSVQKSLQEEGLEY